MENEETVDQASPQSEESTNQAIESKLTKLFEKDAPPPLKTKDETEEKPDVESEEKEPEFEEVEYEGQKYQVPPQLKEAIIHKADYTRKTQEVADARRNIELQAEAFKISQAENSFAQTIEEPLRNLAILESRTKELLSKWQELTADQKSELLYLDKQREYISTDIRGKRATFDQEQQKLMGDMRQKCADAVKKSIPMWNDDLAKEITKHAVSEGYTTQELSSISDPRHIKTLWKAREFDRLQALAKAAPTKITPVVKPGSQNPMPQEVKDKFAFNKAMASAKSPSDKARLIEERFAKRFNR